MGSWRRHSIGAFVVVGLIFLINANINFQNLDIRKLIPLIFIFGILPDLDHKHSVIRFITTLSGFAGMVWLWSKQQYKPAAIIAALLLSIWFFTKHRGFLHSVLFFIMASVPVWWYLGIEYAIVAFIASMSHIIVDNF